MVGIRELRQCPVTGRAVVLNRAWYDSPPPPTPPSSSCWFCKASPPLLLEKDGVCVTFHPTPAFGIEGNAAPRFNGLKVFRDGVGAHELIFARSHELQPHQRCLQLALARIAELRKDTRLRGFRLGARILPHHHLVWQLVALPFESPLSAPAPFRDEELQNGLRILEQTDYALALLAWAPRVPFETWILPKNGRAGFEKSDPAPVAALLGRWLPRIQHALKNPPVDLIVEDGEPWRIELIPRLPAAFGPAPELIEAVSGLPVHGTFPEEARNYLLKSI
jgi:UDPglucose--hexose-1-phosphate uridylyltransferase